MKTVLITVSKDIIRRNILDTNFWPKFLEQKGDARVVLVVPAEKKAYFEEHFAGHNVFVEEYTHQPLRGFEKLLNFLARTGVRSRSTTSHRWRAYKRGTVGLGGTLVKSVLSFTLARFGWYKKFLRRLLVQEQAPQQIKNIFDTHQPNLVLALSLIDLDFDTPVALEAKRRGVRTVGMVRSWDNLNHHGLLAVVPERFLFQNQWLKEAAEVFQAVDTKKVGAEVIGFPHYDAYKNAAALVRPKEEFFQSVGLDPAKKLVFVGGSEHYYSEDVLPHKMNEMIEQGILRGPLQVMFRPHPSSMFKVEDYGLEKLSHIVLDDPHKGRSNTAFTDTENFINLLYYADVTVSIGSTLAIDAAAFGKPAIAIDFDDPAKKLSYWESVKRFNDYFDHQERLLATGGVRTPSSLEEYARDINAYLENPGLDAEGRARVLKEFAEPYDGKAGKRLADIVAEELSRI